MLKSYKIINELSELLSSYQSEEKIADYRIMLNMSMSIDVYIRLLSEEQSEFEELNDQFIQKYKNINAQFVTPEQIDYEDNDYANLFNNRTPIINYGFRKRFDGFFDVKPIALKEKTTCPIVTFYSYKGGMGRTTTLMAYALHCATNLNKKVVILDCDFEAPGYLNFFNLHEKETKNGVVEYLLDKKFDKQICVSDYCYEIENYPNLKIMPAGDLAQSAEVSNYIEALAKLDYSKTTTIVKDFNNLLLSIEKEIKPDIILIDSRTGFSDVFDFTALKLSDLIVAFFGSSEQTRPGRKFLLEKYVQTKSESNNDLGLLLVNSILPQEQAEAGVYYNKFTSDIDTELSTVLSELDIDDFASNIQKRPLRRNKFAEEIGVIENANDTFAKLIRLINESKEQVMDDELKLLGLDFSDKVEKEITQLKEASYDYESIFDLISQMLKIEKITETVEIRGDIVSLKRELLQYTNKALPRDEKEGKLKLFEDNSTPEPDRFFYRDFMRYIFDKDKFIISGFKGTGKTLLFNVLNKNDEKSKSLRKQLIEKAEIKDKNSENFVFMKVTDFSKDDKLFLSVTDEQIRNNINFSRFWLVFIWTKLVSNENIQSSLTKEYQNLINTQISSTTKALKFAEISKDLQEFSKIEADFINIDQQLKNEGKTLFILFDQLDNLVKAEYWGAVISPLVMYWWNNTYESIYPKIFVRTDLFAAIKGTNTLRIKNEMVNIEWTREEVYAYFFKLVFSSNPKSKPIFLKIMQEYAKADGDMEIYDEMLEILKTNRDNQVPLHRRFVEPLLNTFFGKEKVSGRLGNPYDFFYTNLANANGTLSLRPFINWLAYILDKALKENDKSDYPIIPNKYFDDQTIRDLVAEDYFYDLTNEEFNEDLHPIPVFIQRFKEPSFLQKKFRQKSVWRDHMLDFLNRMITEIKTKGIEISRLKEKRTKVSNSVEQILNLMIDCGIVKEVGTSHGKKYEFATMYHYWLGLSGRGLSQPNELILSVVEYEGTVVKKGNGFGFIKIDGIDNNNLYFHYSKLVDLQFSDIVEWQTRVRFLVGKNPRESEKLMAVNIRKIE